MSLLLKSSLLASVAAAQLTTSIWMPGAANGDQSFVGSVIAVQDDRTTISMAFDGEGIETEYYGQGPKTVTVGGTTYVAYEVSATAIVEDVSATATIDLACSRADESAVPTCEINTKVSGGPPDETTGLSDAASTMSGDEQYFLNNFPLVITAGEDKLGASAAATPSASEATPTGSSAQSSGTSAASAASGASASSGPVASGASAAASAASSAASSAVAQATGAAAPMHSLAPVLVGMGAFVAFFV